MGTDRGWFFSGMTRHFDGGDGYALCGCWGRDVGPAGPKIPSSHAGVDAPPSPDDCALCRRRVKKVVADA